MERVPSSRKFFPAERGIKGLHGSTGIGGSFDIRESGRYLRGRVEGGKGRKEVCFERGTLPRVGRSQVETFLIHP